LRIDETHRRWAVWTCILLALAAIAYIPYAWLSPRGASGGSVAGLIYGIIGYGMMVFAALLGIRKKFPIWRIGRAQTWMRGHLWLGLLSYPIILLHGAFHFGGPLTLTMMWIFTVVIVSGLVGAALQHYMPRLMTERVPFETIYDQIDRVRTQLLKEADELLASVAKSANQYGLVVPSLTGILDIRALGDLRTAAATTTTTTLIRVENQAITELRNVYEKTVKPYLSVRGAHGHVLADRRNSKAVFAQLRTVSPSTVHQMVDDLENICEEKRDLDRQSRMHKLLHGWLLVHVPLSVALIVLGAIHAVMALRY
jgi:hypothetical protein